MNNKWGKKSIGVLVVFCIIFICACGVFTSLYNSNTERLKYYSGSEATLEEGIDELIVELSKAKDMQLVNIDEKLKAMSMLSVNYYLKQDYAPMIETAIQTIYLAEKENKPYYAAWNYINMSEVFMIMSEYEMAEELIEKALQYEIEDKEQQDWINETAYIYLADVKAKNGKEEEAFRYIAESLKYSNEDDYDYVEMLLKRNAIKAEIAFEGGDYLYAQSLLDQYPMDVPEDALLMESVYLPVQEIYTKIFIARGELEEGKNRADAILEHEGNIGYEARRLAFLIDLTDLFEGVEHGAYVKYSNMTMTAYDDVMKQNAQIMSKYIFNIYSDEYIKNEKDNERNQIVMALFFVGMLVLVLSVLLLNSRKKSMTDPLTGLYNRRAFDRTYKSFVNRDSKLAVIMFDIDHFKSVNDTYGHEFGDEVLIEIGKIITQEKPISSKLFRMGGEEFCIIYRCENLEVAVDAAESIRKKIESHEWQHGEQITISGGLAFAEPRVDLYKLADEQLYISKNSGRNQISYAKL